MPQLTPMKTVDPQKTGLVEFYKLLVSAVAPRPIAFVSTRAKDGTRNLSPFSYFNVFGANPPVVVFSVSTTGTGQEKDTLRNVRESGECIIHIADRTICDQLNLTSATFPPTVDEFERSGLTPVSGEAVSASRVAEAKIALECKLDHIIPVGKARGAGNLIICKVERLHIAEDILFENGESVDPRKFHSVARLGDEWYLETTPAALFELPRPPGGDAMGVAAVLEIAPAAAELDRGELAILATVMTPPDDASIDHYMDTCIKTNRSSAKEAAKTQRAFLIDQARTALATHNTVDGWLSIMAASRLEE